jgi:hypothetical protein
MDGAAPTVTIQVCCEGLYSVNAARRHAHDAPYRDGTHLTGQPVEPRGVVTLVPDACEDQLPRQVIVTGSVTAIYTGRCFESPGGGVTAKRQAGRYTVKAT